MKHSEKWIWLPKSSYPDSQTTVYSGFEEASGNEYCVAEFKRSYFFDKNIVCVCGSCDLLLENNGKKESLTLNDHKKTVHLNKNIQAELKNYTNDARVVVQYFGENNG